MLLATTIDLKTRKVSFQYLIASSVIPENKEWGHPLNSGVAIPGPTRAQALVRLVCALVKLLNSWAKT